MAGLARRLFTSTATAQGKGKEGGSRPGMPWLLLPLPRTPPVSMVTRTPLLLWLLPLPHGQPGRQVGQRALRHNFRV